MSNLFSRGGIFPLLLVLASVLSVSPIFGGLVAFKGNVVSLLSLAGILAVVSSCGLSIFRLRFDTPWVCAALACLLLALVNSMYWELPTFVVLVYLLIALLVSQQVTEQVLVKSVDYLTALHLALGFGAVIGFLYSIFGGGQLFSIQNPDGRENGFYLSTFSNTNLLGFIRPSGLYDEPGALSFFTCLTVAFRELLGMPRKPSGWLLGLGLITGSLAHLIFAFLFVLHVRRRGKGIGFLLKAAAVVVISIMLISFLEPLQLLVDFYSSRLSMDNGQIAGDNRSGLMENAIGYLSPTVAFWGLDGNCIMQNAACNPDGYLKYGENPLSMLVHYGVFVSFPYYAMGLLLFLFATKRRDFVIFGILLLIMQRPNVTSYGYSVLLVLYLVSLTKFWNGNARSGALRGSAAS